MTGLLVSVRDAEEARAALAGGADVIDVKEPRRGALGPAEPQTWRDIHTAVGERVITSAALGELLHDPVEMLAPRTAGFGFAKIGLAGCQDASGWIERWRRAVRVLPPGVSAVPVAYADWPRARAPSPSVALWLAGQSTARLLLVDTWDKSGGSLIDTLSSQTLDEIAHDARQAGIGLALAGSLHHSDIEWVMRLAPAYVGVRGAACRGGRNGTIEMTRVKSLATIVHGVRQKAAS
jgi:(5-formylfuran-3-yl)methyl phosphate synthase